MLTLAQITDDRAAVYSDLYKDVYGSRPRNVAFASREAFNEEWDYLVTTLEANMSREAQEQELAFKDFVTAVNIVRGTMRCGLQKAIDTLIEADELIGDVDFYGYEAVEYAYGLKYGTIAKMLAEDKS
jgi:hypothetical protein